jgi:thymidylate synthase (FAD)
MVEVLDYGYVKFIESWGSEEGIVEAARMSTQKGFLGWGPKCERCGNGPTEGSCDGICALCGGVFKSGDEKLLRYLYEHKHLTPFEMAGATFEVQAPIFVFREWHRHRTQGFNEMSARYAPLPDVNYVPTEERLLAGGGHLTKQSGSVAGADALTRDEARLFQQALCNSYEAAEANYQRALKAGVPKELARLVLPVGRYSRMRATANLRNWMQFLALRDDANAQWEIRQFAAAVRDMLSEKFPRTMALFAEGRQC